MHMQARKYTHTHTHTPQIMFLSDLLLFIMFNNDSFKVMLFIYLRVFKGYVIIYLNVNLIFSQLYHLEGHPS